MRSLGVLVFVVLTFCCWGVYGPVLHVGQEQMGAQGQLSSLRPLICVGIAYFMIAVMYPLLIIRTRGEPGRWSSIGFGWSFLAGGIGALGALGVTLAFKFGGSPVYVMPLVFGLAPIVNTLVTMMIGGTWKQASAIFFLGIVLVAVGAAGVLWFKPGPALAVPQIDPLARLTKSNSSSGVGFRMELNQVVFGRQPSQQQEPGPSDVAAKQVSDPQEPRVQPDDPQAGQNPPRKKKNKFDGMVLEVSPSGNIDPPVPPVVADGEGLPIAADRVPIPDDGEDAQPVQPVLEADTVPPEPPATRWGLVGLCILVTAVCWGAYGPTLHLGQARMEGSRLRPFVCVGLAYFAVAVFLPALLLASGIFQEPGGWPMIGTGWSLLAGAAGAIGAMGVIYAFNFGGQPVLVMPLIFGFAPVVNTLTETLSSNRLEQVSGEFVGSLALVIVGAALVLVFAPRRAPINEPTGSAIV